MPRRGLLVHGDVTRLTQVVGNVIANAAKYTEPRGRIRVSAERQGDQIQIRVTDSGIGIAADMLPGVFEMFTQDRQALDRAQGGLGLGLTIARSLVRLHDGTIEARSDGRGKGSEFIITLPALAHDAAAASQEAGRRLRVGARTLGRVLVVDDNVDGARLTASALGTVGLEARTAFDGPSALALASSFRPDVILLDLGLPVMDGFDVARQLREQSPDAGRPMLVAITGYGQASDRERTLSAGFDAHVVKPVDLHELVALLERLLSRPTA